jgi:hypothetical protein
MNRNTILFQSARASLLLPATALLLSLAAAPAAARSPCDFMAGQARRECSRAEVAERTEQNREAAAQARAARQETYAASRASENAARAQVQAERDEALAVKRKADAEEIAARRKADALAIAAMPAANDVSRTKLEKIVETDSKGWAFNQFDHGSIHDVRVAEGSEKSGSMTLRGVYTYNGGSAGWVLAKMEGGKFSCVQFWDAKGGCRAMKTPEQGAQARALMGAAVNSLASGASQGGGGGAGCDRFTGEGCTRSQINGINDDRTTAWVQKQISEGH